MIINSLWYPVRELRVGGCQFDPLKLPKTGLAIAKANLGGHVRRLATSEHPNKDIKNFTQNNQLESLSRNRSGHYLKCAMLVTLKELF